MQEKNHGTANFNQITPQIWIGNNMCCTIHNQELMKLGFDADIDLEDHRAEEPPETKIYLWLPTKDHHPPSFDQMHTGVATIREMVVRKLKIYIHCRNGHGRAPTLAASYLISQGKSLTEAIEFIRGKRPSIHLQDSQLQALANFEKMQN